MVLILLNINGNLYRKNRYCPKTLTTGGYLMMLYGPFLVLFFWLTIFFAVFSFILLPIPSFRLAGKKFFFGTISAVFGLISYQFAYICLAGLILILPLWLLNTRLLGGIYIIAMLMKYAILFLILIFWVIVLPWGYISGFRAGWRYGGGTPLIDSIRSDYLARICLRIVK